MGAADYAETLLPVLEEFAKPPLVVGHSFGGRVAVCLAAKYPGRVGTLVLTGVPLVRIKPTAKPKASFRIMRSLNEMGVVSDERMEKLRDRSGSLDYRTAIGIMREVFVKVVNESYEDQLVALKTPVRLLWGSEDKEVPVGVAERSLEVLEKARVDSMLEVLIGVGHLVPIEAPRQLRALIDRMNPS
jgi:pimeloyl-ACP methyl ester carboxylesterase